MTYAIYLLRVDCQLVGTNNRNNAYSQEGKKGKEVSGHILKSAWKTEVTKVIDALSNCAANYRLSHFTGYMVANNL